jgi:hypothetical protein
VTTGFIPNCSIYLTLLSHQNETANENFKTLTGYVLVNNHPTDIIDDEHAPVIWNGTESDDEMRTRLQKGLEMKVRSYDFLVNDGGDQRASYSGDYRNMKLHYFTEGEGSEKRDGMMFRYMIASWKSDNKIICTDSGWGSQGGTVRDMNCLFWC